MGVPKKWDGPSDSLAPVVTKLQDHQLDKSPGGIQGDSVDKGVPAFEKNFNKIYAREFEFPSAEGYPDWQHGYSGGCCWKHAAEEAPTGDAFMSLVKW